MAAMDDGYERKDPFKDDPYQAWSEYEKKLLDKLKIKLSGGDDFSHWSYSKRKSGIIIRSGTSTCNVDPDWGTYDTVRFSTKEANSFEEFINKRI